MRYGVHAGLWMARWTDDLDPILETVASLGFDGVEVSLLGMTEARAEATGRRARGLGLAVTCSDGLPREADVTSDDAATRARGLDHLRRSVRLTAAMGSAGLAGVTYAPWGVMAPGQKAARLARSAETLGALHDTLADCGVTLGVEALNRFETDLLNTAAEATALARATGSDRIGVLLDTFHLNMEDKDIRRAIADTGDRLVHFHVSDNDRGLPGSGHVPWDQVRAGLTEAGYDGWIVAEMFVRSGTPAGNDLNIWRDIEPDATTAARAALAFMRGTWG
jgi:D-psicose/D-tagatose/L-ribulose 3-epimerase